MTRGQALAALLALRGRGVELDAFSDSPLIERADRPYFMKVREDKREGCFFLVLSDYGLKIVHNPRYRYA